MKKLWQKNWKLNEFIEAFETKEDILLDNKLLPFDVVGSIAHAMMLNKISILTSKELQVAKKGLLEILNLYNKGKFQLELGDEDIHTKIENFLTQNYGDIGKKIHTGRSRNDQVLTALRLYTKEQLLSIWESVLQLYKALVAFSQLSQTIPIPGYTHMQKAMPYTLGAWAQTFAKSLLDNLLLFESTFTLINQSPLGSAAGFGIPLEIDANYTAQLLGFAKPQLPDLYCQNSRGKFEAIILAHLIAILSDLNKIASDILLFTTQEFGFFSVDNSLLTGSSIMPQKKNVDVAELIRSKVHMVLGNYTTIVSLSSNLISGYNRDLQDTKKPFIESLETTSQTIQAALLLVASLKPNREKLQQAMTPEIFATHATLKLVKNGKSFRDAYKEVASSLDLLATGDISIHPKMGNDTQQLKKITKLYQTYKNTHEKALQKLLKGGE